MPANPPKEGTKPQKEPAKPRKQKAKPQKEEAQPQEVGFTYRRIGHKGADAIREGNTIESFEAAIECGVDMIELDVLRAREGRLIVAHDPEDALRRRPLDLTEALDAFLQSPLDEVEIDCDLKLPGREAELVGALEGRGLLDRATVSTMEVESLRKLRNLEPDLRLGGPIRRRGATGHSTAGHPPRSRGPSPPSGAASPPSSPGRAPISRSTQSGPTTRSSRRSWSRSPTTSVSS